MYQTRVKIKHLFTQKEDFESIQDSMNNVADVLEKSKQFFGFRHVISKFRQIPKGDEIISSLDYANKLLNLMYSYADSERIWIE